MPANLWDVCLSQLLLSSKSLKYLLSLIYNSNYFCFLCTSFYIYNYKDKSYLFITIKKYYSGFEVENSRIWLTSLVWPFVRLAHGYIPRKEQVYAEEVRLSNGKSERQRKKDRQTHRHWYYTVFSKATTPKLGKSN